ncbi:MAG: AraC family transcriptional activator of pobA [Patiriisocius sp.]|jgi:AraC family transcriptional activator of pobA
MKDSSDNFSFPIHDLSDKRQPIAVEPIAYSNAYDFTKKHRHRYFELLFFEKGGGSQLIDFEYYVVQDHSCYIVMPNQIHLLKRSPNSHGFLIQFYSESLSSADMNSFLATKMWNKLSGIVFKNEPDKFQYYKSFVGLTNQSSNKNLFEVEKARHILQATLFSLFAEESETIRHDDNLRVINKFLSAVEEQYTKAHLVKYYTKELGVSDRKLMEATKRHLGMSPLKAIHARLILEAKRLLVFDDCSQKEIAYQLGFESPSSFSTFVKAKTGMSPTQLQSHLVGIHN